MKISKLTSAYLAGVVDSDGYIGLLKVKKGNKKHWGSSRDYYYCPVVKVAMTNKEFIEWLKTSFGGNFETRKEHGNARESYCWTLRKALVEEFLHILYPYLMIKRKQAEVIFKYKNLNNGAGNPVSDENHNKRDLLYTEIRSLNKRGVL